MEPDMFSSVKQALAKAGCTSLTSFEVKGRGKQRGIIKTINGKTIRAELLPKTKTEPVVKDEEANNVDEVIVRTAGTGTIGDRKIFIPRIEDASRIRTGELATAQSEG